MAETRDLGNEIRETGRSKWNTSNDKQHTLATVYGWDKIPWQKSTQRRRGHFSHQSRFQFVKQSRQQEFQQPVTSHLQSRAERKGAHKLILACLCSAWFLRSCTRLCLGSGATHGRPCLLTYAHIPTYWDKSRLRFSSWETVLCWQLRLSITSKRKSGILSWKLVKMIETLEKMTPPPAV